MVKSPLLKRQKRTETSFKVAIDEVEKVINLRNIVGTIVVNQTFSAEIAQLQTKLAKIGLELSKIETVEVPDMDPIFQGFRTLSKEYDDTVQKICEHIPLLNILEQKKNCPVAKIIDEI